jgi:hypothetical protein
VLAAEEAAKTARILTAIAALRNVNGVVELPCTAPSMPPPATPIAIRPLTGRGSLGGRMAGQSHKRTVSTTPGVSTGPYTQSPTPAPSTPRGVVQSTEAEEDSSLPDTTPGPLKETFHWNHTRTRALLMLLVECKKRGWRAENGWKTQAWTYVEENMLDGATSAQCQNKWRLTATSWNEYTYHLSHLSGWTLNEATGVMETDIAGMNKHHADNPKCRPWLKKVPDHGDLLGPLLHGRMATGNHASLDGIFEEGDIIGGVMETVESSASEDKRKRSSSNEMVAKATAKRKTKKGSASMQRTALQELTGQLLDSLTSVARSFDPVPPLQKAIELLNAYSLDWEDKADFIELLDERLAIIFTSLKPQERPLLINSKLGRKAIIV